MQLHSKFIYSHESHESTESNVFSCKSPTRCMVAVVQDLKSCQRATSFNVAGWVQSNVTSLSWDHQKRPLISLVFVFFITWVGNLRRQALSDIEYISSHHQKKIKTLQDTDLTTAIWFKRSVQAIPFNVTCPREIVTFSHFCKSISKHTCNKSNAIIRRGATLPHPDACKRCEVASTGEPEFVLSLYRSM